MKKTIIFLSLLVLPLFASGQRNIKVNDENVLAAMKKASAFMVNEVSCHGGYLWYYKEDMTEVFGEVPARKSHSGDGTSFSGYVRNHRG